MMTTITGKWAVGRTRYSTIVVLLLAVVFLCRGVPAAAESTIGVVKNSTGDATVVRAGKTLPASGGMKLEAGDALVTGSDGSLGVILRDNSSLSLGPGSRLVLRQFEFSPADGRFGLLARLTRGTMAYVSGLIGKLAPESARFETPTATIGIRGTRFAVKAGESAVP